MRRAALGVALWLVSGCGDAEALPARGQVLLFVDTDAVLPLPEGTPPEGPLSPHPLFDRLTVEVFAPGSSEPCDGCRREFSVDRGQFERVEVSIGIVPEAGRGGHRARVRLFRGAAVVQGAPRASSTLETTVELPPVSADGIVEVSAVLRTDDVGVPRGDLASPVAATPGRPATSLVGTWPPAQRRECLGEAKPGEVCVPGGAFWMGEIELVAVDPDGNDERLVALSPFFLDVAEVTVGLARAAGVSAVPWSGSLDGDGDDDWCTFVDEAGERDERAVNCVNWLAARAFCEDRGGHLPREAQWEYAARALGDRRYVWGSDFPECHDAVWGHLPTAQQQSPCPPPNLIGGPLAPGSGARDRLELPGGVLVDLAGNVSEWMLDVWNTGEEPCWAGKPLLFDPICDTPGDLGASVHSVRGASFDYAVMASAAARGGEHGTLQNPRYGFRCARPGL